MNLSEMSNQEIGLLWGTSVRNLELRAAIEHEIRRRMPTNKGVSKEHLYNLCRNHNRSVLVYFLPTTERYNLHGEFITLIDLDLSDTESAEFFLNIANDVTTHGNVKGQKLNDTDASEMTSIIEFNTDEISHIQY